MTGRGPSTPGKVKINITGARTSTPKTPTTPVFNKVETLANKKRKTKHDTSDSDDNKEVSKISRRELSELSVTPSASRQDSIIGIGNEDVIPRQRRATSTRLVDYIKKEHDADDSGEESSEVSVHESSLSDLEDTELGV
jgi:hypothetical protein